ncbi:bifunctional UDP-N-acetylglucosamine diphosphorylase/glucosamine-1-phosphate N-acetyltransferase GlmU [Anaerosalibacter bizertensis]|uniref:bifunctional UDP-N-acetylglucosamine diphosphorylase/glucosamine-1-phosphate N-acetyltransferase GlmU n=1 Tax=Anaerosalibacter bizertensis TaxID=932217 RepID=UPI003512D03D
MGGEIQKIEVFLMTISIILAAGEGTRMKSSKPKVLHNICGKPLLSYVIDASRCAKVENNIVIVGHGGEKVIDSINDEDITFEKQPIGEGVPYGTGFAVMQARNYIKDNSCVIILYGDTPLISGDTLNELVEYHNSSDNACTVLTAEFEDPKGYGRIIRDEKGNIHSIVEEKDATEEEKRIKEINSGMYCFKGEYLKFALDRIDNKNAQGEYYITDAVKIFKDEGLKVGAYKIEDSTEIFGINSRVQLAYAEKLMRKRINEKHMKNGVTLIDPESTYIGNDVKIGSDTIVYPGAILEGNTVIGEDCIIGHNTRIVNGKISNKVEIQISTILDSIVEDGTKVGPYAYLRPNSHVGKNVKIGDFVEVKNANIGDNSKASHLSYIGDADVGRNVNIGCGVVFVNYNGKTKSRTTVEDNAFIGSNSNLVAPVVVKEWGYIAAGSTITDKVDRGHLAIARARQVCKADWVFKKDFTKDNK